MKKCKKMILAIMISCVFAGVIFAALHFMGIINIAQAEKEDNEKSIAEEAWQIVFKGFQFSVKPIGQALIHESGCLNIRSCDEYLIQIDVEDQTAAEFWERREEKTGNIEASGYTMQLTPEKTEMDGREYIRYIVSLTDERGSDFDVSYFYVLISEASEEKRFLATVRFDGIDLASLGTEERAAYYEKAFRETTDIINSALPADRSDDAAGTYWEREIPAAYLSADSLSADKVTISYPIREGYGLVSEEEMSKTYYSEIDEAHVITSVIPYSWITAQEMAESKSNAGISKVLAEGDCEVNGVHYYYYTYSVMFMKNDEKSYSYRFNAFADLVNGDIYSIHGFTDSNSEIINVEYYYDFMNIVETEND